MSAPPSSYGNLVDSDDDDVVPPPPPSVSSEMMPPPPPPPEDDGVDFLTGSTPAVRPVEPRASSRSMTSPPPLPAAGPSRAASQSVAMAAAALVGARGGVGGMGGFRAIPPPPPSTPASVRPSAADQHPPQPSASSPSSSLSASSPSAPESRAASSSTASAAAGGGSAASLITAADDLGLSGSGAKSFAACLTHHFAGVSSQVEWGSYAAKRAASFLRKLGAEQEAYARNVQKLLAHEQSKLSKLSSDNMKCAHKSWVCLQDLFARIAKSHLAESSELSLQVVAPLLEFHQQQEERRKELLAEERKISLEMVKAREEVTKGLATCTRLLDEARRLQAEADQNAKAQASGEKTGFFKSLTMKVGKKPEDARAEALKAAHAYSNAVATANKKQSRYVDHELPKLFGDMQSLEEKRLDTTRRRLLRFQDIAARYAAERKATMDEIRAALEPDTTQADITEFVEGVLYEHGPPVPPRPFLYELSATPADLEAGRLDGGNPHSLFRVSLSECMERQKARPSARVLDVPWILPTLIARIRALGGYSELGIFRISVAKEDLDKLRTQIDEEGSEDLSNISNPHICAALLKEWLRLLSEPLIPTDHFYHSAIEAARNSSTGAVFDRAPFQKLFESLPPLNQRVLQQISAMVKDISEPNNAEKSKMNVENLAIVFAPSFLRNPSEDPMKLLENSKYETRCTACLFRTVANLEW